MSRAPGSATMLAVDLSVEASVDSAAAVGYQLLRMPRGEPGHESSPTPTPDHATAEEPEPIRCRQCLAEITSPEHAVEVAGGHQHAFFNPAGILFEIGCYAAAAGCANEGMPTTQFSWFPGYAWRFAFCRECRAHLGWQFVSDAGSTFWGLILDRLVEGE